MIRIGSIEAPAELVAPAADAYDDDAAAARVLVPRPRRVVEAAW